MSDTRCNREDGTKDQRGPSFSSLFVVISGAASGCGAGAGKGKAPKRM